MASSEEISGNYVLSIEQIDDTAIAYQSLRRVAFAHIVEDDMSAKKSLVEEADSLKEEISTLCEQYEKGLSSEEEKQNFEKFKN